MESRLQLQATKEGAELTLAITKISLPALNRLTQEALSGLVVVKAAAHNDYFLCPPNADTFSIALKYYY